MQTAKVSSLLLSCYLIAGLVGLVGQSETVPPKMAGETNPGLKVTAPEAGSIVSGRVALAVEMKIGELPHVASVEYLLNGRLVEGSRRAAGPYRTIWNSATVWDGDTSVQTVARDAEGNVLAASEAVSVTVDNRSARMQLISPAPGSTLSGSVRWSVDVADPAAPVEAVVFLVDGKQVDIFWGPTGKAAVDLDTTRFSDGAHELFASAHSSLDPHRPSVAMAQTTVRFKNGRVLREVRPKWRELFLLPGESARLEPHLVYANGEREAAAGSVFHSVNPAVAKVTEEGTVHALAPGIAQIVIEAEGRKSQTRVVVDRSRMLPHFSRDGRILSRYEAGQSQFIRTMFHLDLNELERVPGVSAEVRAAGITAITTGFWPGLAGLGNPASFSEFKARWDPYWARLEQGAERHGMRLLLIGDDIARTPEQLHNSLNLPWSAEALQHAFTKLRDSRKVQCIEMVDEVSAMWGDTPTPSDGRWLSRKPPITDQAFLRLITTLNLVPGRPLLSWPVLWMSGIDAVRNWMGNPLFSGYATFFWDNTAWREAYPWGISLPQVRKSLDDVILPRQEVIQRERPFLVLLGVNGPFYTKMGEGAEFVPGQDQVRVISHSPLSVSSQIVYMAAAGAAGVRAYGYDYEAWKRSRRQSPIGSPHQQTGADSRSVGTDRWQAMAAGLNLIARIEPYLLQPRLHSPNLGPEILTAAREGPRSRLLMTVNMQESAHAESIDFSDYLYPDAETVTRFRLRGGSLGSEIVPAAGRETVAYQPGEAIIWLFQPAEDAAAAPPAIRMKRPFPGLVVSNTICVDAATSGPAPARVEFLVDGRHIADRTAPPFRFEWDTTREKRNVWQGVTLRAHGADGQMNEARAPVMTVAPEPCEAADCQAGCPVDDPPAGENL